MRRLSLLLMLGALGACPPQCGGPRPDCVPDGSGQTLSLHVTGGSGAFTLQPEMVPCTSEGGQCSWVFPRCTAVQLTASPRAGFTKVAWTGCDAQGGLRCEVMLRSTRAVTATLEP